MCPKTSPAPDLISCDDGQQICVQRLAAVRARDPAADGLFYYAVRTAGVYCRPSCAARPAKVENILFYDTTTAAEHAGYRACKRCRPAEPDKAGRDAALVQQACEIIAAAEHAPTLETLARTVGVSAFHFHRTFKSVTGITPKGYINAERTRRLREGLNAGAKITTAVFDAGYNSSSRFYDSAQDRLGMTATAFRDGAKGATIRFAVGECSLGAILVAATDRGICTIEFADDPVTLVLGFQDRFRKAHLVGADGDFERLIAVVVGAVEAPHLPHTLSLDVRGTVFQERVWQALRAIPPGEVRTYTQVAVMIGHPAATRAVANACGANQIAFAIPCHRVIRTDGGVGGYRWGIARKQSLLAREAGR